jgi:hypothetical protein
MNSNFERIRFAHNGPALKLSTPRRIAVVLVAKKRLIYIELIAIPLLVYPSRVRDVRVD